MFNNFFFEYRAVYEIMWKATAEPGRPQMTIWHMRIACWIHKATNTQSELVILIAFPLPTVITRTRLRVTFYVNICFVLNWSATHSREALPIHRYAPRHISIDHKTELKIVNGRFLKNIAATCSSRRLFLGAR
jgi:hypothetical protein